MIRYCLLLVIFIVTGPVFAQEHYDQRNEVICHLSEAKSFKDITVLIDALGSDINKHMDLFMSIPCINPLNPENVKRISSNFGKRFHPIDKKYKNHNGIDITSNIGKTVHAAADGIVVNIEYANEGYGKNVTIQHQYGYSTKYAHMALVLVLEEGQKVSIGEPIGMVGSTGKSTGNHLHYEVLKDNIYKDPALFLKLGSLFSASENQ